MDTSKSSQTRSFSPLKSPILQRHLRENIDINYPEQFITRKPTAKRLLIEKDGSFRCAVDVQDFTREEVSVSTIGHTLLIKAAHEEKDDGYGEISRSFSKKYILPYDIDVEKTTAWISKDILYVKIPQKTDANQERKIEIK
ncbi:hypothetical protein PVAND_002897 [Polypedilum vanderplanki]|uniref:SHSP domain-containing protein n=1 Tax=Polypedilum vanderplanki TaxID=319348 RepID=A0A9J6BT98_POLVA|nr:hypothetical protein PVAND_002897 [Polypedilum vanderplanki]